MQTWFQRSFIYKQQLHKKMFIAILCTIILDYYGWTFDNIAVMSWFCVIDYD